MSLSNHNGVSRCQIRFSISNFIVISFRFTRAIVFSIFPAPKKSINDEIVLITGSGGVLGRSLAVEFSKYGAFLCLWDIDEVENQKTYELLHTKYNHRRMVAMKVDITFVSFRSQRRKTSFSWWLSFQKSWWNSSSSRKNSTWNWKCFDCRSKCG